MQLVLSMLIFGTIGLFRRLIPYPTSVISFIRGIIGVLFLFAILFLQRKKPDVVLIKKKFPLLCLSAFFLALNWICLLESYQYTSISVATVCYYMSPVVITIASTFLLKEKLTVKKLVCICLSLMGLLLVSGVFTSQNSGYTGVILALGAAVCYGSLTITNKFLGEISGVDRTIMQLGFASVFILPYVLITNGFDSLSFSFEILLLLLIVGILHTGIAFFLYFAGVKKESAQTTAIISYIDPISAIILSSLLLKEPFTPVMALGVVLVLGSTVINEFVKDKK